MPNLEIYQKNFPAKINSCDNQPESSTKLYMIPFKIPKMTSV